MNLLKLLQTLLWEANLKNIMSGQDVLSPLIQPLPRVFQQDDPQLIEIIRQKYLIPPPDSKQHQYNIRAKNDTSMGQAQTVRKILNNKVLTMRKIQQWPVQDKILLNHPTSYLKL